MSDNALSLHRIFKTSPEKLYRAFTEPAAVASWYPPYGYLCTVQEMEVKIGGTYKMTFHNFTTGNSHSFSGHYAEVKPNEFLKYSDQFDDPDLQGEITTSVWLRKVPAGTELKILQENIPSVIPIDGCYVSWQECLEKLQHLVEPEIEGDF